MASAHPGLHDDLHHLHMFVFCLHPTSQVAYAWATSLSEDDAASLLRRLNLAEGVVDYSMEIGEFSHAFQLAQLAAKQKLPDVHLKYAMFLEDSGRFLEAEGEFVAAGKTGVGFGLCVYGWTAVGHAHTPQPLGCTCTTPGDTHPHHCLGVAGKPREAIDMYLHNQDWAAAMRVADRCEPGAVDDIHLAQVNTCWAFISGLYSS